MIFSSVLYLYRGEDIMTDKMFNDIIDSLSIMQLMMKLKSLEKSSITISSIISMMVKCIRNCLMNLIVPFALTADMSTSLDMARIKMEIKDIYVNIVIRLSRP